MTQNLYEELLPIIIEWIGQHPKYGPLDEALKHRGLCHQIIYLNEDGYVYSKSDTYADTKSGPNARYMDPNFFDKITELIESHLVNCEVCKELIGV